MSTESDLGYMVEEKVGVITMDGCPACEDHKKLAAEDYKSGKLVELPIESEQGMRIANRFGIDATPSCVILDNQNRPVRKCFPREEARLLWKE